MISLLAPIAAALVAAAIEFGRILLSFGATNVNKLWTYTIGVILFGVCLAVSLDYYDEVWPHHVAIYALYYACCRGMFYDITLNILRCLPVDYKSKTTNSKIDKFLYKYSFWMTKVVYLIIALITGYTWQQLLLHSI